MLASSPLIRSIISTGGHLPPSYQAPVLIIPAVSHDTLEKVSVILATGKLDVDLDTKVDVETALSLLGIDIGSYSYRRDDHNVNTEFEDGNENINSDFLDIRVKLEDMEAVDENNEESMNILINSVKTIHVCNLCGKTYANKYGLYRHLKRFHDLVCSRCNKKFVRKYNLMKHIEEVHKKSKIVSCTKCNKKFRNKYNLIRHIEEVHEKSKIVSCTTCNKNFSQKYNLIRHIEEVHEKSKIVACTLCSKNFTNK